MSDVAGNPANRFWPDAALFAVVGVAIAAVVIYVHAAASLTLPVPWGDEAYFIWQARAFERWNTFIAPELDPNRPLLLLPFVYGAVLGACFKIFGFSLELARHMSLLFVLVGFGFLAALVRRWAMPLVSLVLIGAFLLNGHFVAMANIARMEAMLFAVFCGALLLVYRGRLWTAIAVLSLSLMIHPNGVFYLVPVAIYAIFQGVLRRRPSRAAIIVFSVSALAWLANGLGALAYWDGFVYDTALRIGQSTSGALSTVQFGGRHALLPAGIVLAAAAGIWLKVRVGYLLAFAVGGWLHRSVRIEQWYEPFGDLAFLLILLAFIQIAARMTGSIGTPQHTTRAAGLKIIVLGACIATAALAGRLQGPRNYLEDMQVFGMRIATDASYFTAEDEQKIRSYLSSAATVPEPVVEIYPWGDGLLLSQNDSGLRFQVPYYDSVFYGPEQWVWGYGPTEYPNADIYIVRTSRHHPEWIKYREAHVLDRALAKTGASAPTVIHSRDGSETWYAVRPAASGPTRP